MKVTHGKPHAVALGILVGLAVLLSTVGAHAVGVGSVTGKVTLTGRAAGTPHSNVIVSIEGLRSVAPAGSSYMLDQKNMTFLPRVLPVLVGSTVEIRNSDRVLHTVHTVSTLNQPINRASLALSTGAITFQKPEEIVVRCDVHSEMRAFILVKENTFFTKIDREGRFTLTGIPEGTYTLRVWTERAGNTDQAVSISGNAPAFANVVVR